MAGRYAGCYVRITVSGDLPTIRWRVLRTFTPAARLGAAVQAPVTDHCAAFAPQLLPPRRPARPAVADPETAVRALAQGREPALPNQGAVIT